MQSPRLNTAVSRVLASVFRGNNHFFVFDYGHRSTFADLWLRGLDSETPEIGGCQFHWNDQDGVVLIVSADAPADVFEKTPVCLTGINFREHLTAASWAAAWRLKFPSARARVILVEPSKSDVPSGVAKSLGTVFQAREAHGSPLVSGICLLRSPSLERLCGVLGELKDEQQTPYSNVQAILRASIWDALTSDREGHHAVSNVLGALLLSFQVGKGLPHLGDPWAQDYLLALVQACGATAGTKQVELEQRPGPQRWVSGPIQAEIAGAVLLDDMSDVWEYFLRGALGFIGDQQFPGTSRSYRDSFVTSTRNSFRDEIQGLPCRLTDFLMSRRPFLTPEVLISGQHKIEDRFVLFLDLRLFSKQEVSGGDEARNMFFRGLAEFGLKLLDSVRNLPWIDEAGRMRLREEFARFLTEIPGDATTRPNAQVLPPEETLLPRLLSLLDPTLPIVIFSSTRRSELIDPFRDYANIITTFRKPVLSGMTRNWSEVVKELRADFLTALEQAVKILKARKLFRNLA